MSSAPTYPIHVACLACDPAPVFHTLRHLFDHLHRMHPEQLKRREEQR